MLDTLSSLASHKIRQASILIEHRLGDGHRCLLPANRFPTATRISVSLSIVWFISAAICVTRWHPLDTQAHRGTAAYWICARSKYDERDGRGDVSTPQSIRRAHYHQTSRWSCCNCCYRISLIPLTNSLLLGARNRNAEAISIQFSGQKMVVNCAIG